MYASEPHTESGSTKLLKAFAFLESSVIRIFNKHVLNL